MAFSTAQLREVDEALKRAKEPLRACREQHGVTGDIEYRLRYNGLGEVESATIERSPPGLTPTFIEQSITTIKGTVKFPAAGAPGIMNFVDLGPASAHLATEINAEQDRRQAESEAASRRKTRWIVAIAIILGIAALIAESRKKSTTEEDSPSTEPAPSMNPSWTPSSGPSCSTGCRCGNSCIDCSKKCRK